MKKSILLLLIVAFAATVNAQTSDKKWGLGVGIGAYGTLNNGGVGIMPELYLSRFLSPRFDIMLKSEMGVFNSKLINNLDLVNPLLNLRLKLSDENKSFRPYLFAGPGYLYDNRTSNINFDLGLGAKYYMKSSTALYLEAGYIQGIESTSKNVTETESFWKATLGLEFDFGKTKDSDMDGVSDKKDKCPDTPAGVAVDANGCPLDSDGDGVADYIDDCPTVAGLASLKGCPDRDKDGIADKDDDCPDVFGLANLKGCPDSDGDGVADKDDKCPDTPKGWKVDATGCPYDNDKDGLFNEEDDCPNVAGPKENKGCPVVEKAAIEAVSPDMMIEPVYFDYDKSNILKVEKAKIDKLVSLLKENKNYNVMVNGYADSQGADDYNLNLSKQRASTVVKSIVSGKIQMKRIEQKGFGEANPAANNDTPEGRAINRRVEFELIKTK